MKMPFSNLFGGGSAAVRSLSPQEAISMVKDSSVTLLDVREVKEIASTGKAKGAINIPLFLLKQKADPNHPEVHPELDVNKPVLVYCASGARSGMAGKTLAALGYSEVFNIGALGHWQSAGGACER